MCRGTNFYDSFNCLKIRLAKKLSLHDKPLYETCIKFKKKIFTLLSAFLMRCLLSPVLARII